MCNRYRIEREEYVYVGGKKVPPPKLRVSRKSKDARPTDTVPVFARLPEGIEGCEWRWGWTVPFGGGLLTNSKSETINTLKTFQVAARQRRCLMVGDAWVEWKHEIVPSGVTGKVRKIPHEFRHEQGLPLFFAGIWQEGKDGRRECSMLTRAPDAMCEEIHNRQPLVLHPDAFEWWLSEDQSPPNPEVLACCLRDCWKIGLLPNDHSRSTPISGLDDKRGAGPVRGPDISAASGVDPDGAGRRSRRGGVAAGAGGGSQPDLPL